MNEQQIICPRCRTLSPPGTEYCRQCDEVLSQEIRGELRRLAVVLRDLDTRIATDKGSQTVADLREEYFLHYEDLRHAPWQRKGAPAPAPESLPAPAPFAPIRQALDNFRATEAASEFIPPPAVTSALPEVSRVESSVRATPPPPAAAPRPHAPAAPVFSWQSFATEQSIAIIGYLAGFLALIATLSVVVSRGETQKEATLLTVALIYLLFGVAGFSLRRVQRLRTLSSVYLAVFALMTPLVALALYRYELQDLHVPAAGVLCISALYATVVYLGLAVQTRFATYAYLGWSALIVATLAFLPWFHHDLQWWAFDLGATTIALLGPHYLRQHPRLGLLAEPATQLAAVATVPAVIGVQALGIIGLWQTLVVGAFPTIQVQPAPLALGACILVPLTAAWRLTVPTWRPNQQNAIIDTIDGFNAVFFAEAVGGVTIWLADLSQSLPLEVVIRPVAISLAFTALAECGLALALLRWQPHRRGLRTFLEVFSVVLAGGSALIVSGDPAPNWPMVIALSAALVISVGTAIIDGAWWLLVSGFFMLLLYGRIVEIVLTPEQAAANALTLAFVPALAAWLGGLTVGFSGRTRRFGGPIYVVALGYALYSLTFFPNHDVGYQTTILLTFMAAAFIAGLREQQPIPGSIVTGFFGLLAVLPFAINDANGLDISLLALALTAAALAARRLWGRIWTLAPYAIALWAIVVAAVQTSVGGLRVPDWSASGLPFTAWMLLFFAAVAYGVALWEDAPLVTAVPAVLAFWALQLVSSDPASVALVFVLIAAGMAARQWRGRDWNIGLLAAAAAGSISVAFHLNNLGVNAPNWQVAFLLALAVAAYLVAAQEGEPALTAIAVVYALVAVALLPGPNNLLPTLVLTFTLVGLGIALHLPTLRARISRQWAFGLYAAAIGSSIFATARVVPFDAGKVEGLLLIFAAIAYIVVALEEAPVMTFIPLLYAAASVFVQPDEHALLPLALVFAVLGLLAGRVAGMRWAWAFYAAAFLAASSTIIRGDNDITFQALSFLILALLTYVIAAVESRPDVLLGALLLGLLALGTGANVLHWQVWQATLAFVALGWLYALGARPWAAIPWLRATGGIWWVEGSSTQARDRWRDPRWAGALAHRIGGLFVVAGAALVSIFAPNAFDSYQPPTLTVAAALLGLAGVLILVTPRPPVQVDGPPQPSWFRLTLYLAGGLAAFACTWVARWLGADNVQAFVLVPGSYLLVVGVFLPADQRVPYARRIGQFASLSGSLVLLLPTLFQSFNEPGLNDQFVYASVVIVEALLITGLGVGSHSRSLTLVGIGFVILGAINVSVLAIRSGVSVALVIGALALLLIGLTTWLSLRSRRESIQP